METKSTTAFSAAIPVPKLLDKHNYPDWTIRVRTYLKGQDIWKVIIDKDENAPAYENDDVDDNGADDVDAAAPINVWRRRNYMALHVIQISCGPDAFAEIRSFRSTKTAWQTLKKKYLIYADLYRAVHRGNLTATKDFLDYQREAVSKAITNKGQTALHIAVTTGHAHIVKELVSRMSKGDLGIEDGDGYTALTTALVYERSELALYFMVSMRNAFPSGNRLVFWKQWIYNCNQSAPATFETHLNVPNVENGRQRKKVITRIKSEIFVRSYLLALFWWNLYDHVSIRKAIKQLYEMKKLHIQSQELVSCMCEEISTSFIQTGQLENIGGICDAITLAVKNGISEFVLKVARTHPSFLENKYRNSRNILMLAVLYRQYEIFSNIDHGFDMENTLTSYGDCNDDNILHMVGMIEDSTMLNQISGAALHIIVNPKIKESTNKNGLTPRQLFTKNHGNMKEKGEKWMKGTALSSIVVATLVVTITFASVFTIPGGYDQTKGFPILYKKIGFKIFIVLDAMYLFLSSTLVLKFLEVLTTRYTEEDFLEVLLKKMIVGFSTLMLSFLTMMMAFFVALVVMLADGLILMSISLTIYFSVPVIYFIWTQFCILRNMIKSTYSRDIFNRKMKLGFS
ncbi:hypothetical protein I3843_14G032600 [Carya illinoinensis]|nr:hypothetical protein I3843_14G032600 [Carya illinoinensis]